MVIAGEPSGDTLAAELVRSLRRAWVEQGASPSADLQPLETGLDPRFFGAGGSRMAEVGVELAFDMTEHAVVGLVEVLRNYGKFKRLFDHLLQLAFDRQPDAILCVDFSGFNRRFARAVKREVRRQRGPFKNWDPKIVQYVSPQVWASRPGRARAMARDFDLVLSIFPFEKAWYAEHAPQLPVVFVGHPIVDRYAGLGPGTAATAVERGTIPRESRPPLPLLPRREERAGERRAVRDPREAAPTVLLLPGSRVGELKRHLPVMLGALEKMQSIQPGLRARMVLPNDTLARLARTFPWPAGLEIEIGALANALARADLAIASTGTVTMECAFFGLPTVAIYKTSWSTYQIGKRIIQVRHLAMPNLLAGKTVFPELIQDAATSEAIARESLELLNDPARRTRVKAELATVIGSLGGPGASRRAAQAVLEIL